MKSELYKMSGPLLILAGPGTGKTHHIIKRIKYLVEERNIPPEKITVITFTDAAARNMQDRISDPAELELFISREKRPGMISTMHSLGYKILREKPSVVGLHRSIKVVYSNRLRDILVGDAAQLAGFDRAYGEETGKCRQFGNCNPSDDRKCKICQEYEKILRSCCAIDYDDQILLACKILEQEPEVLRKYSSCCEHLLVDEYQDINAGQFKLISLLSKEKRSGLFVVGDDDQSIYSWRGGSPQFIRNFKDDIDPEAQIKSLEKSFRCHRYILEGAISVVTAYDKNRLPKAKYEYEREIGKKIQVHNVPSDEKEAATVRKIIERALSSRTVLVLLPHRGFCRAIVEELRKGKIQFTAPLTPVGEGLPLISVLSQWLKDNSDSLSFRECLESFIDNPVFGVPSRFSRKPEKLKEREKAFSKISNLWKYVIEKTSDSFWKALEMRRDKDDLYSKAFSTFDQLRRLYDSQEEPAVFIAEVVKTLVPWKKTRQLLEEVDCWVETSRQIGGARYRRDVRLATLQGAKGLEADVVCIIGVEEGILPRSGSSSEGLAEQSRLMFVSMTRASEELHMFHARKRSGHVMFKSIYKKGRPPDIQPSSFIKSIPNEYKEDKYHPA